MGWHTRDPIPARVKYRVERLLKNGRKPSSMTICKTNLYEKINNKWYLIKQYDSYDEALAALETFFSEHFEDLTDK